jgi:hypothetical protein
MRLVAGPGRGGAANAHTAPCAAPARVRSNYAVIAAENRPRDTTMVARAASRARRFAVVDARRSAANDSANHAANSAAMSATVPSAGIAATVIGISG